MAYRFRVTVGFGMTPEINAWVSVINKYDTTVFWYEVDQVRCPYLTWHAVVVLPDFIWPLAFPWQGRQETVTPAPRSVLPPLGLRHVGLQIGSADFDFDVDDAQTPGVNHQQITLIACPATVWDNQRRAVHEPLG